MNRMKIVASLVFLLSSSPALPSPPQESTGLSRPSVTAGDIVKRYIQASGGSELRKIGMEKRKGTLVRGISGPVPFETTATASGKWHYHQVFAYGDRVSYGFDGGQAWIQDTEGVVVLPPEERLELILLLDIQAPLKLERLFPKMTVKGSERIGEKAAVVLAAVSEEGFGSELAFDKATGLLLRAGDLFFEDYRDFGKVKRPFLVFLGKDTGGDSLRLKMQVSEIRQDVEVDESIFSRPNCSLHPVPPLFYKLRKEVPVDRAALEACVGVYQSNADPNVLYTVTTQGPHLMIERTGWGTRVEIRPESETDYFMRFLHREFHFVKDAAGRVTGLETGTIAPLKRRKLNSSDRPGGETMDRKQFLKRSLLAGLGCCGAALGFGGNRGNPEGQAVTLTEDLTRRIRDGAKSPDWRKMEEAGMKFKAMMDHMDEMLDEETKIKLLNACGRSCFIHAFGVADERKSTPEQGEAYLKNLEKNGFEVRREKETITVFYRWGTKQNPYGLSMQEGFCMCPIVESGAPGMSKSYCNCSGGYVKEALERATGKTVLKAEVLESILQGGKDCRFKVVMKA